MKSIKKYSNMGIEARIKETTDSYIKMEIKVPYTRSMLESEELLQKGLNSAGLLGIRSNNLKL